MFQIFPPYFLPFYIWPPSPFPLQSRTHHFLSSPESLIHFVRAYVSVCVCVCGGVCVCDVCTYGEMISEAASSHVN